MAKRKKPSKNDLEKTNYSLGCQKSNKDTYDIASFSRHYQSFHLTKNLRDQMSIYQLQTQEFNLTWTKTLSSIFRDIGSKHNDIRESGALRLQTFVAEQSQEMKGEFFTTFMQDVNHCVKDLTKGTSPQSVLSGILALNSLLGVEFDIDDGTLSSQWWVYLRTALHQSETLEVAREGSKCLGRLARIYQGTLPREFLDFEIRESLEWLSFQQQQHHKRQTAVLILAELIKNVPTLVSIEHVEIFFDLMNSPLQSTDLNLRLGTVEALRWSLKLIRTRATDIRHEFYQKVYNIVDRGFQEKSASPEALHGTLLALGILLTETGTYMADKFSKICLILLNLRDHKNSVIKRAIIQLVPKLAKFYPDAFALNYLSTWTAHLIGNAGNKKSERVCSLGALAKMANELGPRIKLQSDKIMELLIESLQSIVKNKAFGSLAPELYSSISSMAKACGADIEPYLKTLIPLLISTDFSEDLVGTLSTISYFIPSWKPSIQEELLIILKNILYNEPALRNSNQIYKNDKPRNDKTPKSKEKFWRRSFFPIPSVNLYSNNSGNIINDYYEKKDIPESINRVVLALDTLSTYDFDFEVTKNLISQVVVKYLEHENATVRRRAVVACGKLLVHHEELRKSLKQYGTIVVSVLQKLMSVALTDESVEIRQEVLKLLDSRLDSYLSQEEYLSSLFLLLYDGVYEIRELAVTILGRLTENNPGCIYPTIRTLLLELTKQVSIQADNFTKKEIAAKSLGLVVKTYPKLVRPYSEALTHLLIKTTKEARTPRLSAHALSALGDLSASSGTEMRKHLDELLPIIIEAFQDQTSSSKREHALIALTKIIENTGYVIEPLIKYPKLLDIILNKIKREDSGSLIRIELIRLLGIIGSLDPHKYKEIQIDLIESNDKSHVIQDSLLKGVSKGSEDYYPAVALSTLIKFLRNPHGSHAALQPLVIQATMTIFRSLGIKCIPYLKHFLPLTKKIMIVCGDNVQGLRELIFQQLCVLVSIIKHYTRDYLPDLLDMIENYWEHPKLTSQVVLLVEEISIALNDEFASSLKKLFPKMLKTLQRDISPNFSASIRILQSFCVYKELLDELLHQVIPAVTQIFCIQTEDMDSKFSKESKTELDIVALQCLANLALVHDLTRFSLVILHPLYKLMERSSPVVTDRLIECLCNIALNLGQNYKVFINMFHPLISKLSNKNGRYNTIVLAIQRGEKLPLPPAQPILSQIPEESDLKLGDKININSNVLSSSWDTSRCFTKTDWSEWIRKLSIALLSESSSPALRSCSPLAKVHPPVARELFNAGFLSCWNELTYDLQQELTGSLENAFHSNNIPPEILQILLDLAEFMEHNEKALPIDTKILAALAIKCHAYAKALYYKETEFRKGVTTSLFEDIISINYQLQLHDAAQGMLKYAQETPGVVIKLSWYEKLQRWTAALGSYEALQKKNPEDLDITVGRMRCMHDLGHWDALSKLSEETWPRVCKGPKKIEVAVLALSAFLNLYRWEAMNPYIDVLNEQSLDGSFYRAIHCVYNEIYDEARRYIDISRDLAATELTALIGESYSRSYMIVVRIQQLAELEEIVTYKQLKDDEAEKKENILRLWKKRLQGVERNVEVWQSLLSVRSLVELPKNNVHWWTKFANLVRKSDRPNKSRTILTYLLIGQNRDLRPDEPIADTYPMVKYSYLNLLWSNPQTRNAAYREMEQWVSTFNFNSKISSKDKARCYAKLARWQVYMYSDKLNEEMMKTIVTTSKNAVEKAQDWHKAHHVWAIVNYKFVSHYEKLDPHSSKLDTHLLPAISGFIKSIALAPYNNLQDILQLFTLWFKYGSKKDVERSILDGFDIIDVYKWLSVIPQLMARIHISLRSVRHGIHKILTSLGKNHPQALVFPLTVARQSPFPARVTAAQSIMSSLRQHSPQLLDETLLVSSELIRVAILWKEKWYKGLDEASRCYYIEKKTDGMATVLQRLNEMLERGPETISEQAFVKAFGRDLQKAWELTKDFLKTQKASSINQAWDLYGHVFRTIKRQLSQDFDKFHLKNVSPKLMALNNLQLAVPGTYSVGKPVICIKGFNPTVKIISSKQQPRKIVIHGINGLDYPYLLKGHEDLRQDERIMQLFGLVNTFLELDSTTAKSHLSIHRFAVIPLSINTGLIEWVPHCDTPHELIKHYRKTHSIPLDAEQMVISRFVPRPDISSYYKLTPLQKLEAFEAALDGTSGYDLEHVFYLNSKNSEEWLDKRTTYTRSLAVISMVGYILGLGDRHPNNFLLNRNSGKIMHIDFGDCFDVAMHREKFAEKVPFRLTRMLVNAMEVCGIEGTFRLTAERVMKVLRMNAESIIAVLEAFVHDPLINWKLNTAPVSTSPDRHEDVLTMSNIDDISDDDSITSIRDSIQSPEETSEVQETLNAKALSVIERVSNKLSGSEFKGTDPLDVQDQISLLLKEATSNENLCQSYLGWCPYW